MKNDKSTQCAHVNETPFMTNETRLCPVCGDIYNYDSSPVDFDKIFNRRKSNDSENE